MAIDGTNVRVNYGVAPEKIVWVTRDPFGGPVRRLCWDLVLNQACQ